MLLSEYQNQTQFEVHLEKFQSGLNVKKWKLEKLDCAEKDYTWEQVKQWSMGKMRSSLNFLLSGFSASICACAVWRHWWDLPGFQIWCWLNSAITQNRHFCMFGKTGDSHFSTGDSIHGFSGWFKLKSQSPVLTFKDCFFFLKTKSRGCKPTSFFKPYKSPRPFLL